MARMRPVEMHEGDGPDDGWPDDWADERATDERRPGAPGDGDARSLGDGVPPGVGAPDGSGPLDHARDDADADQRDADGSDADGNDAEGEAGRRRGRRLVAGGAALLVVGAFVVQGVVEARRAAHVARFDDVPGVLAPVDGLPVLRGDVRVPSENGLGQVGDVVLVQREGDLSTVRVEALDRATGSTVWTRDVPVPDDLRAEAEDGPAPYEVDCRAAGTGTAVCAVRTQALRIGSSVPDLLVTLDAADGTVLDRQPVAPTETWAVAGTSVLTLSPSEVVVGLSGPGDDTADVEVRPGEEVEVELVGAPGEATWTVHAGSATDGEPRWRWDAPTMVPYDPTVAGGTDLAVVGDHVLATVPGHWWLLDADGALVREGTDGDRWWDLGRGGALVSGPYDEVPLDDGAVARFREPGDAGFPARFAVDDGSVPDVTFTVTSDQVLRARHARTDEPLWEHATDGAPPLLLDGTVHVLLRGRVLAVDARTGAVRWSADAGDDAASLATDGRRVLALPGSGGLLRAFALGDGALDWEGTLPGAGPSGRVVAVEGVLLLVDGDDGEPTLVVARG